MKSLITGVTGFGGSHLAEHLLSAGDEVHGIARSLDRKENIASVAGKIVFEQVDLIDREAIDALLRTVQPEVIYHLAGEASAARSLQNPQETVRQNVIGTVNLLESARRLARPPRIVLVTSSEMYGNVRLEDIPLTEASPLRPLHAYALSKVVLHYLGRMYHATFGLPIIEARAFNHIGPRQSAGFVVPDFARQIAEIAAGKQEPVVRVGNLEDERDFTDVRDVARAYRLIGVQGRVGEVYHICSGRSWKIRSVLETLIASTGVRVEVVVDPAKLRPSKMPVIRGSFEKLDRELSWKPEIPIEKSLGDTLQYWKEC